MSPSRNALHELPWQADISQRFALIQQAPGAVLLDSNQPQPGGMARFDIASAWPLQQISPEARETPAHFLERARQLLLQLPAVDGLPDTLPFAGGLLGYLGYHFGDQHSRHPRTLEDARIGLYAWALINDHQQQKSWLFCHPALDASQRQALLRLFSNGHSQPVVPEPFALLADFAPLRDPDHYRHAIKQIQDAIGSGQIRQVNYTQRFSSRYRGNPWLAYQALRQNCPVPYAAFIRLNGDNAILSLSPERFIGARNGQVEARPIKGTRRRGHTPAEDMALAAELLASNKDRTENRMIVELQKDELAPLCHDIHTPQLAALESYPNVHHLVSCIRGTLNPGTDALDLLQHCFPGASISGTPKQPVLEMIDQLEASSREIYCGSIFYLDRRGRFDSSVCIRTLLALDGDIHCWGGGGITEASDWQAEYQESVDKVSVLMQTLQQPDAENRA